MTRDRSRQPGSRIGHRWARLALAAVAATALVAGCGSSGGGGGGSTADGVPHDFYGIVAASVLDQQDFSRMSAAGVGSLRVGISWPSIQLSRNGPYSWSASDQLVAEAARAHIPLLVVLDGTPSFEADGCSTGRCSSHIEIDSAQKRSAWKAYVRAVVQRYGRHGDFWGALPDLPYDPVTKWQIWNEQNNPNEGNPANVYAGLLRLSKQAVSSVDPKAEIITGGMFGTPKGSQRGGVTAWSYLRLMYRAGAAKDFDAVALHPYAPGNSGLSYQIKKIRGVMSANHDPSAPILITEIGWGSSTKVHPGTGSRGAVLNVSPEQQKANLTRSYNLLTSHRKSWRIGGIYWYTWEDPKNPPPGLCAFCYSSGLYAANGKTAKPALSAFEKFTGQATGG
jgi:hypothetical protein